MYTLLRGGRGNLGDYLWTESAKRLLRAHRGEHELFELLSARPIDEHLEKINRTKAIIICGGPGYQPHFYPGVYPLTKNLNAVKVPIIPMGLGWKGFPGGDITLREYTFTPVSLDLIRRIHRECAFSSCRDYATQEILKRHGCENVIMTGCPAWYDMAHIGEEFCIPAAINRIVFTPAHRPIYFKQTIDALHTVQRLFPHARRICSFHVGLVADRYTAPAVAQRNRDIKDRAEALGFEVVDVSSSYGYEEEEKLDRLGRIAFYRECDMHIGYRLHAHAFFLSQRKPSFLLSEDGRGIGASEALGTVRIPAWNEHLEHLMVERNASPITNRIARVALLGKERSNRFAVGSLTNYIEEELTSGFARFRGLARRLDRYYDNMVAFLQALP